MGHRDVKRVALDFEWPMNKVWKGYINPHWKPCQACDGRTETPGRRALSRLFHNLVVAAEDSVFVRRPGDTRIHPHPWLRESMDVTRAEHLTPDIDELVTALVGPNTGGPFGRNSYEAHQILNKLVEAAGLDPKTWGVCKCCDEGHAKGTKEAYDAWQDYEPPAGEGWQLWETVSEGSPISPVFKTSRELARWAARNATLFASNGATEEEWLRMFDEDSLSAGSFGMFNLSTGKMGSAKDVVLAHPPPGDVDVE